MNQQEQRIREFAYEIWQSEGCPEGQELRHWEMARKLVESQDSPVTARPTRTRKAASKPVDVAPAVKPVKAAVTARKPRSPKTSES